MGTQRQFCVLLLIIFLANLTPGIFCENPFSKLEDIPVRANVSYGDDPEQIMDIYPAIVRNETMPTKVIIMLHGGGWSLGAKEDLNGLIVAFRGSFPQHVLANMNYRLGTIESPGFPKQVDDIGMAVKYLKDRKDEFKLDDPKFGLVGSSAGGHLALLYGFGFDVDKNVNVIANIIGPSALHVSPYTEHPAYKIFFKVLVGNVTFAENPEPFVRVSPVSYIQKTSPKTIGFYGIKDLLVPVSQGRYLEDMLDDVGVYNKRFLYPAGHGNFTSAERSHIFQKLQRFFTFYL